MTEWVTEARTPTLRQMELWYVELLIRKAEQIDRHAEPETFNRICDKIEHYLYPRAALAAEAGTTPEP